MTDTTFAIPGRNSFWNKERNKGYPSSETSPTDSIDLSLQREKFLAAAKSQIKHAFEGASDYEKEAFIREILEDVGFGGLLPLAKPAKRVDDLPTEAPSLWLKRVNRHESPADFIKREYAPWISRGFTQAHILHLDKPLYTALHKWFRTNELPADLDLPTRKQMNDRLLEKEGTPSLKGALNKALRDADPATRERIRLYNLARLRTKRAQEIKTP
jgi:hypothetical protein